MARPRPYTPYPLQFADHATSPARAVESEGLSQAELRQIVIELIG